MGHTIIGAGEILWDVYPDGPRFGGAPANFAGSSAALASSTDTVTMVSAVGTDELGQKALKALAAKGVKTDDVQQSEHMTGQVFVHLDEAGIATYEFAEDTAWDHLKWRPALESLAARANAICFGSLGQRSTVSRDTLQRFVSSSPTDCLRVFDINLRDPFYEPETLRQSLEIANVLKMNDDEFPVVAAMASIDSNSDSALTDIAKAFDLHTVALTEGARGARLWRRGTLERISAPKTDIVSTVGAGDAFTAALVRGLLDGCSPQQVLSSAVQTASVVCSSAESVLSSSQLP